VAQRRPIEDRRTIERVVPFDEDDVHKLRAQNGQALVEFALVLPIIFALVIGVLEFGQAFNYQNDLTNMANQAMRYAEVDSCAACGAQKVETYIPTTADTKPLRDGTTVCFSSSAGSFPTAGQPVTVKVSAPFTLLHALGFGGTVTISSTVTGRLDVGYNNPAANNAYTLSSSC
jgi:TadE-like protein